MLYLAFRTIMGVVPKTTFGSSIMCMLSRHYHIALSLLENEVCYDEMPLFEGTRHELLCNNRRMLRPNFVSTKK